MTGTEIKIPDDELLDRWHAFQLKTWRQLQKIIEGAKSRGLDEQYIAERLGIDVEQVNNILSGESAVSIRVMHNLARAINFRPEMNFIDLNKVVKSNYYSDAFSEKPIRLVKMRNAGAVKVANGTLTGMLDKKVEVKC